MALITCKDVSFDYEGHVVVSGLSFSVERGDYLCVVGENGSGKSTLIKGLLRLKYPKDGNIEFGDGFHPSRTGYLPQQDALQKDFPAGVFEVVLSGRLGAAGFRPFYNRADKTAARENMERLGILDLEKACYRELSGGQRQRVLLARALCASRELLLLDEPASGLDPVVTGELYKLIEAINRDISVTVIMVSHDIAGAMSHAKHILHLQSHQAFYGTAVEYRKSEPGLRFSGGGVA